MYYAGLPSSPLLLARTGQTRWHIPKGPEAYRRLKQLGIVVNHKLNTNWLSLVAPKIQACLDRLQVKWTSLDVVRIGEVGAPSTITLWIGAFPRSLNRERANSAAFACLGVLQACDITDVDVEIRESLVICSAGPSLLAPVLPSNPTAEVCHPLTHALGLHISPQNASYTAGTGGFFMALGANPKPLLLVTARHVVFPNSKSNHHFEHKHASQARHNVLLLGDEAYPNLLTSIKTAIGQHGILVEDGERRIEAMKEQDDEDADMEREVAQSQVGGAKRAMERLYTFFQDVKRDWATTESRILGHVIYSPSVLLSAGTKDEQFTRDYAIIEVDNGKIDRTKFNGNMLYLGDKIPPWEFTEKMHTDPQGASSFKFPANRLLKLHGTIPVSEMCNPTTLDGNKDPAIIVIKRGITTDVTIGRASSIMSIVRKYFEDGSDQTSHEWAILPYDNKSGAFSARGDSGAVVVDSDGRIGGLLTGGAGLTASTDISYVTPIDFLLKDIKKHYPNAHPNPV